MNDESFSNRKSKIENRKLSPQRWRQIDDLLDAVLDLPETERERFLSEKCGDDAELKAEVRSLLKLQTGQKDFLETSAMRIAAKNLADAETIVYDAYFVGKKIGSYTIENLVGAGGMGEVYLATDAKLNRKVALKILPPEYTSSDERLKRFQLEARAISLLNHPNIVTVYDVGNIEGLNYIATEYVEGETFRELIKKNLKLKDILSLVIQVCDALSTAHSAGIIHRDIKPENIMVRPDGYVKILDFGLAKLSNISPHTSSNFNKTAKGVIIGTPAYMSPEQVADEKVDHRTDLWSLGVILYELLTGTNPFKKENRQTTFQAILSQDPPPASEFNAELPAELDRILIKALEKDADLSYQTASDLRADLKRVNREFDSSPSTSSGSEMRKIEQPVVSRSFLLAVIACLLLALAAVGIWLFINQSKQNVIAEATEWANPQHSQITDSPWVEGYPSLSPDGKNIVFAGDSNDDRNIFLQRVGGKTVTNLTPDSKESDTMPAFSPDGRFIAFRSARNPGGGIYLMEETGENVRRVSDIGYHPSWSPDGKKLVVSDKAAAVHTAHTVPNSSLWTIDIATGEKQKLETAGDAIMPNWSPNGKRIAYWFVADGNPGEIATVPAEGGKRVVIASDAAADWNPVWSPDGKYIYFASNRAGTMNLWRVPIDETSGRQLGEPESVAPPSRYCRHITFSRDGKHLGYVRYESKSNLQSIAFDPKTLKTVGDVNWITRGNMEIGNPQISPDGELFLVRNPTHTQEDLAIFDKTGNNWRSLMNDTYRERNPRWSPDGTKIAFQSDRSGKYQIWLIDSDGSNLQQITFTEKTGAYFPVFSPDGKRLIFTEADGDSRKPLILDLSKFWNEQTPQPLPSFPESNVSFSARDWSKDGNKLLVSFSDSEGDDRGIAVFDFGTSRYEKITGIGNSPFWLNDNRYYIFTSQDAAYLCDTLTKKITQLYKPSSYELQHTNISFDNKMIFFRYLQVDADVWLISASPDK